MLYGYEKFFRTHASIRKKQGAIVEGQIIPVKDFSYYDMLEGVKNGYYHRFKTLVFNDEELEPQTVWVYQQVEDKE